MQRVYSRKRKLPLVSILIPNFNHSRYLDQCIRSALNQTYLNREIVFMDNSSTDDSVKVAAKYMKDGVIICRNQFNILNNNYRILAEQYARGKYFILLCADDYIQADFIENAVAIMEKYPNVGYVHGERDFVTPNNELIELEPFYDCSFVAPGRETMPVYMVTTVAHPAQGVVRKEAFERIGGYEMEIAHMNADRSLWFYLSYEYDAAYMREKMSRIRIGAQTETVIAQKCFQHPILCHLTIKDYVDFARSHNLPKVWEREGEAMERLAREFVGYAGGMLYVGDFERARVYLDYAVVVSRDVANDELYQKYDEMIRRKRADRELIEKVSNVSYQHKRNYKPPQGYEAINPKEIVKWLREGYKF